MPTPTNLDTCLTLYSTGLMQRFMCKQFIFLWIWIKMRKKYKAVYWPALVSLNFWDVLCEMSTYREIIYPSQHASFRSLIGTKVVHIIIQLGQRCLEYFLHLDEQWYLITHHTHTERGRGEGEEWGREGRREGEGNAHVSAIKYLKMKSLSYYIIRYS